MGVFPTRFFEFVCRIHESVSSFCTRADSSNRLVAKRWNHASDLSSKFVVLKIQFRSCLPPLPDFRFSTTLCSPPSSSSRKDQDQENDKKMHLLPREEGKLLLSAVGNLAQRRLARGLRLNLSEATGLIASVLQELIRDGNHSVAELMALGESSVLRGVA